MITSNPPSPVSQPSRAEMADFLAGMRRLVLEESTTQRYNLMKLWAKSVPERVALGRAIESVQIAGGTEKGNIILHCVRNNSRFREGDILRLNRGIPIEEPSFQVTLERDDDTELEVSLSGFGGTPISELMLNKTGWILDEDYLDLSGWIIDAINQAGDTTVGREQILPLLMMERQPQMDGARFERGLAMAEHWELNWSQSEALAQSYATDLTYLIQGPPGTGKTRVLAHLAQALVEEGERVFITSFTHRAINNALNTTVERAPDMPLAKIGQHSRADDLLVENYEHFGASPMAEMDSGYALGGTPFATRTRRLGGVEFDTVIFDESSQITLPLAIMGMLTAQRFIFIGDHRQLPPVLTTRSLGGAFRESVFGVLVDRGFDTFLDETYRLNEELTSWPSAQFYEGQLISVPSARYRRIEYSRKPERFAGILDPEEVKVFVDLGHRNATTQCRQEASIVIDLVMELMACGVSPDEIGVVAPYRAQGRAIRNLLRKVIPQYAIRRQIVTDTVERMQGQERDVIIVSLTTSNPAFASHLAEFFFQPERLNVAITRPRKKLIIVGSRHVLEAKPDSLEWQAAVDMLRDLINSCSYRKPHHGE